MRPTTNPRAAWPSNDDMTMFNLIVILVGTCLGSYLLWKDHHAQISAGVMALRHQEMLLLGHVTDKFHLADQQIEQADPSRVKLVDLYGISDAIGRFWRIPACLFMAALAFVCMVGAAPARFKRDFDLDRLTREQARSFPWCAMAVRSKLRLMLPAAGDPRPADYALTPEEWIERYATDSQGNFDESRARAALRRQLGPRWAGPETATPAAKLLFVAFALHHSEQRREAAELLGVVSAYIASAQSGQPEGPENPISIPREIVASVERMATDPEAFKEPGRVAAAHAYAAPALMSVLNAARRCHGVLAPAQFGWLKLVDRPLWYALHSLGFETEGTGRYLHPNPRVEALGARDHWAVECAAGEPVVDPDLDRALAALRRHAPARSTVSPGLGLPGVGARAGEDSVRTRAAQPEAPPPAQGAAS